MGKKANKAIPDRWLDYVAIGQVITGTKIVTFKVPLKTNLCQQHLPENEWFTPAMLLEKQPKLKTVIDLTNTFRYYNGQEEFSAKGIDHVKILVEGRGTIPTVLQLQKFYDAMDHHMEKYRDITDALIGVHCTHGLNRTGYFVCRWMLERLDIGADDAIERFNLARGHNIERHHLLNDLRGKNSPSVPRFIPSVPPLPKTNDYRSPLEDSSYDEPSRESRYSRYSMDSRREHSDRGAAARDRYFGNRNPHQRIVNERHNDPTKWRRPGGGGPSRADLDMNWRARETVDSVGGGEERNFRDFGGRSNRRERRQRNESERNRSPLARN